MWLIILVLWGIPFAHYRSQFRKIIYETDSWLINIKPLFWKELKGLVGNVFPQNPRYLKMRNFYRIYLLIYLVLIAAYVVYG